MIIKYYDAFGNCQIDDDIERVVVHFNQYRLPYGDPISELVENGEEVIFHDQVRIDPRVFTFPNQSGPAQIEPVESLPFKRIDAYLKDNTKRIYAVHQFAYICNDAGKTIEKVSVSA